MTILKSIDFSSEKLPDCLLEIPFINEEDMKLYRKDIIKPYFTKDTKSYSLYSLFMMDSRDIYKITIDDKEVPASFYEYFKKIAGPRNDYGILQKLPVRLKWMLEENGISTYLKKGFKVTFLNEYLDEDTMELKKQEWETKDVSSIFMTDYMRKMIKKKE